MAGCWLQWMAPLRGCALAVTDGDAMTAMGLYVSALLIQGYSEERGPVRINCTATYSSKYARV
eukprot:scaffold141330_cov52-Attheya_sp.AAC.3